MNKILCPKCNEQLFPEVEDWVDGTYDETCPYCFGEYSYKVEDGIAYPWEPPKNVRQTYNGAGKPGGKKDV